MSKPSRPAKKSGDKKEETQSNLGSFGALLSSHLGLEVKESNSPSSPPSDSKLVYSTDPNAQKKCDRCRELLTNCTCVADDVVSLNSITARLRIEKKGRGGKTVTVIDELPRNDEFLKDWTQRLKKKCGTGGTYEKSDLYGVIEIQGDHRDTIRAIFKDSNIRTKG
jgi:translation initiation factor 1